LVSARELAIVDLYGYYESMSCQVRVTPLQMARLIAAVFNGGILYQPKVIQRVGKEDREFYGFTPTVMGRLKVKPENLELVKKALTGVVMEPRGTGTRARVEGISVAGKTGTAQVVSLSAGTAGEFNDHAWFVALAPTEKPTLALAIVVEHGGHGGSAAAPMARELIAAYLKNRSETPSPRPG
jgi:penicillin-binding protein 2